MFRWIGRQAGVKNEQIQKNRTRQKTKEAVRIAIATDLHYLSKDLTDYGEFFWKMVRCGDGKMTEIEDKVVDAFVADIIRQKPDVLVLTGDLTFDGAKKSHERLREKLQCLIENGIKVCVFPGNHDLCYDKLSYRFCKDKVAQEEGLSREEFPIFYNAFGYGDAIAKDPFSLSYVAEPEKDIRLFFLDTNGIDKSSMTKKDIIKSDMTMTNIFPKKSIAWLNKELKKANKKGCICLTFSHQNLLIHNEKMGDGCVIQNCGDIQKILEKYNVSAHFSGHMHTKSVKKEQNITEIITASLLIYPNEYGMITVQNGAWHYEGNQLKVKPDL